MALSHLLKQVTYFLLVCAIIALIGNAAHPSGIQLSRDYFPRQDSSTLAHDYQTLSVDDAFSYWEYRTDEIGGVYFVDARREKSFNFEHIPDAINIDRYQELENVDQSTIDKLRNAGTVIVYCTGGDCEDSIFLANDLVYRWQVPADIIYLFEGGMTDWLNMSHPTTTRGEQ